MTLTTAQIATIKKLAIWIAKRSPICAAIVALGLGGGWLYADSMFLTKSEADAAHLATDEKIVSLEQTIQSGFVSLTSRMDMTDAENLVRDLQSQVRLKEREIADLEAVLVEIGNASSDSANVLRNRAFTAKQDLTELRSRLVAAEAARDSAVRQYRQPGQ